MESPSSGTPADAAVAEAVGLLDKAASPCGAQKRAAEDAAAFGQPRAERPLPALTNQPHAKRRRVDSSRKRSDVCNICTCCRFLKKLWDIVESELFRSVWWSDNGRSVVIHEEMFEEEVLSRRCCMKIFHSESMESFSRHLHRYGFTKEPQDLPRSGSLDDLMFTAASWGVSLLLPPAFQTTRSASADEVQAELCSKKTSASSTSTRDGPAGSPAEDKSRPCTCMGNHCPIYAKPPSGPNCHTTTA